MAISDEILTGQLKVANLTLSNIIALQGGILSVNWDTAIKGNRSVLAVQNRYSLGDTSSTTFKTAYACLSMFVGQYAGGNIDPNAQNPGTIINVTNTGSKINSNIYPFTNQTTISLLSYQSVYYALYGNNPYVQIFVADGVGGFNPDYGTAPDYTYVVSNDATSGIASIGWVYGVATSGYVLVSGVQP